MCEGMCEKRNRPDATLQSACRFRCSRVRLFAMVGIMASCQIAEAFHASQLPLIGITESVHTGSLSRRSFVIGYRQSRCPIQLSMHYGKEDSWFPKAIYPEVERVVAIGDVHGDAGALRRCLLVAELIDSKGNWAGGSTHLVQVGDILDRGQEEIECLRTLTKLQAQAKHAGGAVHMLLGNHEVLNADQDFAYVRGESSWQGWHQEHLHPDEATLVAAAGHHHHLHGGAKAGLASAFVAAGQSRGSPWALPFFKPAAGLFQEKFASLFDMLVEEEVDPELEGHMVARAEAFRPGGPAARRMARMPVCLKIGDTVLVHGGLRTAHLASAAAAAAAAGVAARPADALDWMNRCTTAWLRGVDKGQRPKFLGGDASPIWMRDYGAPHLRTEAGEDLDKVLEALGARRMVVGHTPQPRGINACPTPAGREVWRCDTGMSSGVIGGPLECLEICAGGVVSVLTPRGPVAASARRPLLHTAAAGPPLVVPGRRAVPPPPPPAAEAVKLSAA